MTKKGQKKYNSQYETRKEIMPCKNHEESDESYARAQYLLIMSRFSHDNPQSLQKQNNIYENVTFTTSCDLKLKPRPTLFPKTLLETFAQNSKNNTLENPYHDETEKERKSPSLVD